MVCVFCNLRHGEFAAPVGSSCRCERKVGTSGGHVNDGSWGMWRVVAIGSKIRLQDSQRSSNVKIIGLHKLIDVEIGQGAETNHTASIVDKDIWNTIKVSDHRIHCFDHLALDHNVGSDEMDISLSTADLLQFGSNILKTRFCAAEKCNTFCVGFGERFRNSSSNASAASSD